MRRSQSIPTADKLSIGIVIVAFGNESTITGLLDSLNKQMRQSYFLVLIDNHPSHACASIADKHPAVNKVIRTKNIGFARGCNEAAKHLPASVNLLLFLNPDTLPADNLLEEICRSFPKEYAACMPILTIDKYRVNSAGNVVHMSGLSWCDSLGQPIKNFKSLRTVSVISGACLCIRRAAWEAVGGFETVYFMYYEDTELSFRLVLLDEQLGLLPGAQVQHDYVFDKGRLKWFYLERNRYLFIARIYPFTVILLLLPLFFVLEIYLAAISVLQRRFWLRIHSQLSALYALPSQLQPRCAIQLQRKISAQAFLKLLVTDISSPILMQSRRLSVPLRIYHRLASKLVGVLPDIRI